VEAAAVAIALLLGGVYDAGRVEISISCVAVRRRVLRKTNRLEKNIRDD
jgi:hypothetical protein